MATLSSQARGDASVGELVSRVATDLSTLVRQELGLAKAEVKQEVTQAGKAVVLFAVGGVAGLMVLVFLSLAAMDGMATAGVALWLSALIVAAVWVVLGGIAALVGRGEIKKLDGPKRTLETVKEDVAWVKSRAR
jgi:hypothetical protein